MREDEHVRLRSQLQGAIAGLLAGSQRVGQLEQQRIQCIATLAKQADPRTRSLLNERLVQCDQMLSRAATARREQLAVVNSLLSLVPDSVRAVA